MPARRTPTLPTGTLLLGLLTFAPVSAGAGSSLPHSALSGTRGFSTQDQSGIWSVLAATGASPGTPTGHCAVYDPTDNRMLVYYGSDVWALTLDASPQWTQVQVLNAKPPFRNGACAIMDPVRHRLIVFGGYVGSDYDRSTWILTLDGTPVWSQLPVVPSPGPRLYASAIYDPIRDRMIVFGGESGPSLNDVWALKLSGTPEWSQIFPDGGPPNPRYGHVAIYDPTGDRMVILGGWQGDTPYMDPWALSLGASPAWTSLTPSGPVPPARVYSSAVYDAANSRMVMFAGYGGSAGLSDTWALNFGGSDSFEQLAPLGVAASARWLQTGIYDPVLGRMIIFGGLGGADLRALSWGGAAPVGAPVIQALSPRFGSEGGQVVILGTSLGGATSVDFNGVPAVILSSAYSYIQTQVPIGATSGYVHVTTELGSTASADSFFVGFAPELVAASPDSGKIDAHILLLGHHFTNASRVAFQGMLSTAFQVVSDSVISTVVPDNAVSGPMVVENLFGVTTSTWSFRLLPWDPKPYIQSVHDAPNDQGGKVVVRWAHSDYDATRIHTVTGYRIWRRAPLEGSSSARLASPACCTPDQASRDSDPSSGRGVLPAAAGEFWEEVAEVPAAELPGYAFTATTLQDSLSDSNPYTAFFVQALTSDRLTFYSSPVDSGYSVDNLSPPMPTPFAAVYLPSSTELHWSRGSAPDLLEFRLYRGPKADFAPGPANLVAATADTHFVDVGGGYFYKLAAIDVHGNSSRYAAVSPEQPVATLASLISVEGREDRILLTWYAGGNPGLLATVYRRSALSTWSPIAQVSADGEGFLRFEDHDIVAGTRYGYRLGIQDAGVETFVGEAWATAERPQFALAGLVPNPSTTGTLNVQFTLSTAEPAGVDIMDIGGRQVATRDVTSLGPGRHEVDFRAPRIVPGVYLIRLRQGQMTRISRAVVLR